MAKLKGAFNRIIFVKYEACFYDYKINFNSTVI